MSFKCKNLKRTLTVSTLLLVVFLVSPGLAFSQTNNTNPSDSIKRIYMAKMRDSIMFVYMQKAALKYPAIRQLTISNDYVHKGDFESNINGNELFKSKTGIAK